MGWTKEEEKAAKQGLDNCVAYIAELCVSVRNRYFSQSPRVQLWKRDLKCTIHTSENEVIFSVSLNDTNDKHAVEAFKDLRDALIALELKDQ